MLLYALLAGFVRAGPTIESVNLNEPKVQSVDSDEAEVRSPSVGSITPDRYVSPYGGQMITITGNGLVPTDYDSQGDNYQKVLRICNKNQ